jgi:hypothetical protein
LQRIGNRIGVIQRSRQHGAVLDRHTSALSEIWQCRVHRIAQERSPAGVPVPDRGPIVQRPAVASLPIGGVDDRLNIGMPTREIRL